MIRDFEHLALDDTTELEVDDAIAGLAVLLADPAIAGKERTLLTLVGATLHRLGLNERLVAQSRSITAIDFRRRSSAKRCAGTFAFN
ncbi:hypothetical protein CupriaWKF_33865 [Cupriavidus sp. WKF15]|uniref:hypothetical protein n=1 Tax=Cupriavidus sp. WKF15 TaxID=3032282 RepID=UPI0023E0B97E|nr:hypothetical protein [Cupriavidus sp. WKF15]WER50515.1 hypothetical protein CupriaWKF_33865 [Cupriavidus sp. WKF15]